MILKTAHGDRELRGYQGTHIDFSQTSRIPSPGEAGLVSHAGKVVTVENAFGLPPALSAVRLLSESTGMLPLCVYRYLDEDRRERAGDAWQHDLLHNRPNEYQTTLDLFSAIVAGLNGWGNAFARKAKGRGRVAALDFINPAQVKIEPPKKYGGEIVYKIRNGLGWDELTRRDLIHFRAFSLDGGITGVSPIGMCRHALGAGLSFEEFLARFYSNDATPGGVLQQREGFEGAASERREELRESWNARHQGASRSHQIAVLPAGWEYNAIGISPKDAQFVEAEKFNVQQIARIFRVPARLLEDPDSNRAPSTEQENMQFLTFSLGPWLRRIELTLQADDDLFPPGSDLYPEYLTASLLRADLRTRYQAYKDARQAGWLTANEIRRLENMPAHEEGDELQATPVGGAPNDPGEQDDRIRELEDKVDD